MRLHRLRLQLQLHRLRLAVVVNALVVAVVIVVGAAIFALRNHVYAIQGLAARLATGDHTCATALTVHAFRRSWTCRTRRCVPIAGAPDTLDQHGGAVGGAPLVQAEHAAGHGPVQKGAGAHQSVLVGLAPTPLRALPLRWQQAGRGRLQQSRCRLSRGHHVGPRRHCRLVGGAEGGERARAVAHRRAPVAEVAVCVAPRGEEPGLAPLLGLELERHCSVLARRRGSRRY